MRHSCGVLKIAVFVFSITVVNIMVYASEHSITVCLELIHYGCPRVIRRPDKRKRVVNANRQPFNNSMALEVAGIASKQTPAHYIEFENRAQGKTPRNFVKSTLDCTVNSM